MNFTEESRTIRHLESSAMADIIFLLLIFFLLSSSFILRTEIPVNPPKSTSTVTQDEQPIVITITKEGETFVDQDKVEFTGLATALGSRLTDGSTKAVVIRGDESISLKRLVETMDIAREVGAEKIAIATEQK
ncbi:MAG: biopolymer transporter ExbD [Candidatus Eisenbacteria bacterium]|uniref:Biopolymer transporter ExbD n=1 Tax=Eiseniibacteriota bacterium TaxID=2212470 RepID=A0A7Y2H3W8_UNCEI|nr:biopolymer transporter ExbD [Candidatus Eisenbacteria bacterium]